MAGQEQQQAMPQAVPMGAQTPLDPDIMKKQQEIIRQQQNQAVPTSHLPQPQVNPKFAAPSMGQALKSMIPYVGQAMQAGVKAKKEAEVNKYAMVWQQLDAEWEKAQRLAGGDINKATEMFKASPTYQSMFNAHDPKAFKMLKEMQQVFQAPWLDDGGESSSAVKGMQKHMQLKSAAEQATFVQKMQQQFEVSKQAQPAQTDPKATSALNESVRATTGVAREQRLDEKPNVAIQQDSNGNIVAIDRKTMQSKPVTVDYGDGKQVSLQGKQTGKNGVLSSNGVPVGVYRNGQAIQPGDKTWTGEDARHLETYQAAYKVSQANMDHRVQLSGEARAKAFAAYRIAGVVDSETGNVVEVTAEDVHNNPGKYAPVNEGTKIMARNAIFGEIDATAQQVNDAIDEMGDASFDEKTRAQLAKILQEDDPKSAFDAFLRSNVAETLNDGQIKYVTSLVSMTESAQGLRSIAGLGQGSDMVRSAIKKMLPSANTPSGSYAKQQMRLFNIELNALRKGVPGIGNPKGADKGKSGESDGYKTILDKVFPQ